MDSKRGTTIIGAEEDYIHSRRSLCFLVASCVAR